MRSFLIALVALLPILPTFATPLQFHDLSTDLQDLQDIEKRCPNPCGYYGQLCCASNQYCYTDGNGQAQCGQGTATTNAAVASTNGQWQYYTTTYVETDLQTITTVFSSFIPATTAAAPITTTLSCSYSMGETPCGTCCCLSGQYCAAPGQCVSVEGSSGYYSSLFTVTTVVTQSGTASAPLRGTSNSVVTVTSTGSTTSKSSATTTVPFQSPVGTSGVLTGATATTNSGGLSGGAIAGIVIGVILGIIILLIICLCCCAKGIIDGILAIFGLGPRSRRREETTIIEERRSRRDDRNNRTWFGTRPARASRTEVVEKRGSGWGGLAGVAAALGGLALILGLKRSRDRRNEEKSDVSYSYYDSEYSSASSESSDRRTRDSRRSRSRGASRVSRR